MNYVIYQNFRIFIDIRGNLLTRGGFLVFEEGFDSCYGKLLLIHVELNICQGDVTNVIFIALV